MERGWVVERTWATAALSCVLHFPNVHGSVAYEYEATAVLGAGVQGMQVPSTVV